MCFAKVCLSKNIISVKCIMHMTDVYLIKQLLINFKQNNYLKQNIYKDDVDKSLQFNINLWMTIMRLCL